MTQDEKTQVLTDVVKGIAPVLRKTIDDALAPFVARVQTLEREVAALRDERAAFEARVAAVEGRGGLSYEGVWVERLYQTGAAVTHDGAVWIARCPTNARPGLNSPESRSWTLAVKSGRPGRDGRDGRDGKDAPSLGPAPAEWESVRHR